jgi:pantoate--beta-alanine ligase
MSLVEAARARVRCGGGIDLCESYAVWAGRGLCGVSADVGGGLREAGGVLGVAVVFAPAAETMYPAGTTTFVDVGELGERLDGASRPGHFRGVATIVARLLNIVGPDRAYFGQKDAAQAAVLRRMVRDLNLGVEVRVCPIVREADGLAMSSRNAYLSAEERARALVLRRALDAAEETVRAGERNASAVRAAMLAYFSDFADPQGEGLRLDYAEVVDAESLLPVSEVRAGDLVAVAAWVGRTRLIDNFLVGVG